MKKKSKKPNKNPLVELDTLSNNVVCLVCGKEVPNILSEAHFKEDCENKEMTVKSYLEKYPQASIKSPRFIEEEMRIRRVAAIRGKNTQRKIKNSIVKNPSYDEKISKLNMQIIDLSTAIEKMIEHINDMERVQSEQWLLLRVALECLDDKKVFSSEDFRLKKEALVKEAQDWVAAQKKEKGENGTD